jgi:hypothetical protein
LDEDCLEHVPAGGGRTEKKKADKKFSSVGLFFFMFFPGQIARCQAVPNKLDNRSMEGPSLENDDCRGSRVLPTNHYFQAPTRHPTDSSSAYEVGLAKGAKADTPDQKMHGGAGQWRWTPAHGTQSLRAHRKGRSTV